MAACNLFYKISSFDKETEEINKENYLKIREKLLKVGVYLKVEHGILSLSIPGMLYDTVTTRHAGRKRKKTMKNKSSYNPVAYRYSDIILMIDSMPIKDIYSQIGMARATFFRHLARMKDTKFYKSAMELQERTCETLNCIEGDDVF